MGKLILVIGQTGSGKGALISSLRQTFPEILFPVSCTTRAIRPGEVEGETYFFVTPEEFQQKVDNGEFLEWTTTDSHRYGTLKSQILKPVEEGHVVLREVDVKGAHEIIGGLLPREHVFSIYIDAGSWEELETRILSRASMSQEELESRRLRYSIEAPFKQEADFVVENKTGKLEVAQHDIKEVVREIIG
ncbi:MAG: guanylate kinase [Patescibacteria group bacterium]